MKRTSKVISIMLSVFMLMQMMTGVVFAASKLPTDLHWGNVENGEAPATLYFTVGGNTTSASYKMSLYKNGILADAYLTEMESSDALEECDNDFADAIIKNGSGRYSVKIGVLANSIDEYDEYEDDADIPVIEETQMSDSFNYIAPANKYPAPTNLKIKDNILSYDYDNTAERVYHKIRCYVYYPNGEKIGCAGSAGTSYHTRDISEFIKIYNNMADNMEKTDASKYDKSKAKMLIEVVVRPENILTALPSDISSIYADGSGSSPEIPDKPIDRTVVSEKYYNAAKICYDLGIMPKIYENYNQNVIGSEFNTVYKALTGYDGDASADSELTYSDIIVDLVDALGYAPAVEYKGGRPVGSFLIAAQQGITNGVSLSMDSKVTYEQLAQLVYNSLECPLMKPISWGMNPVYDITDDTRLYQLGYSKYTVNAEISGNNAAVKGKVYNKANKKGVEADTQLAIKDNDIKTYADKGMELYVKDGNILSGFPYYYARVKINNGDKETTSKNVLLNFEAYGYSKYKIGDGEYSAVPESNTVDYTLDPVSGDKSVKITFANADESKTVLKSASINLINKHTITYMVNGNVFETVEVDCGSAIPALDKMPAKEGYAFDGWENLPEIMPDNDITVNAKFIVEPPVAAGTFSANANAKWSLSKDGTLYISGTGSASVVGGSGNEQADHVLEYMTDRAKAETIKKVVVGEGITDIGDYVLYELYNAEEITLPSTLKTIGKAFMKGSSLKNVVIPANVASVNMDWTFIKCENLESVYFLNKDIALNIPDESSSYQREINLYGYSDSSVKAYADAHSCTFISIDPDFAINNGAAETTDKNVKISLNDYAKKDFMQYKINDGEYKNIDGNDIDFVLDSADGEKTISITFKNDSYEIEKTHKIIFNNKHKITFKADGEIVDERTFGCGAQIPVIDGTKAPAKEGYVFLDWNTLPHIMPDSDIIVNALYLKKPESTLLDTVLTDEEKADGISVKSDITVAEENANIQTELINKYSKYTASLIINIDISKGKDENFERVTETNELLAFTVDIPSEIQGKAEYIVLREHNGTVDALTTSKNADGEYIEVKDNTIIIHAKKFSAYQLIAKDADPTSSRRSGGRGGSSSLTVKFETNGAPAIKSVSVSRNNVITAPTAPVKDGFVFDGWYTDKNFATKFDFNTKITESITLYAKWVEKAKTSIILTIGQKDATINGKTVSNDVAPKIVNDRTMLPIRFIAEALGAKVDWIEESQTVKITAENIDISLVIGEDFATVNGEKIDLDSPSFIENDRTYLPIRFVSEKLGADVKWDDATQTVNITK